MTWFVRLLLVVFTTFASAVSAQATVFPPEGGKGDRGEEVRCPSGHILVGFSGRTGYWIDNISLMCAPLAIPGFTTERAVVIFPARGGIGGSGEEKYCEANAGIRDIRINFRIISKPNGGKPGRGQVASIDFSCVRPADGSFGARRQFGPGIGSEWADVSQVCPGSEYATGLTVRYGAHVNAVGLICSVLAPAAPPIKVTGGGDLIESGMEDNTDRAGSDYERFELGNPKACQDRCKAESDRCRAWTYVRPGVQGPNAVCFLKTTEGNAKANTCCISGVSRKVVGLGKKPAGEALSEGMENDTDRPGSDIHRFELQDANPGVCQARCAKLGRCKAWTYVRPGVQGPNAVCYLKDGVPQAGANKCCVSGVKPSKTSPGALQEPDGFAPYGVRRCKAGYISREARPADIVCVTPESRALVGQENAVAPSRWDPSGAYGPNTCIAGFVWREAFDGDVTCVTPERRAAVKEENRVGPSRTE